MATFMRLATAKRVPSEGNKNRGRAIGMNTREQQEHRTRSRRISSEKSRSPDALKIRWKAWRRAKIHGPQAGYQRKHHGQDAAQAP